MKRFNAKYIWWVGFIVILAGALLLWYVFQDGVVYITKLPRNEVESSIITNENVNVSLVVKEPDIINPMTMCVDRSGAIYVSESYTYRYGLEGSPSKDSLVLNPIKKIVLNPDGKLFKATVVAEGFANPVMGIDIFKDKLYATCLNELFVMDIGEDGQLSNKTVLVKDSAQPWNPFGMYRVAVGPDAKLWLAMADHPDSKPVTLTGSDGLKLRLRGQSGGFVRCNLDGSGLELVVQGFRAPFAFDFDPWGHLWAISNGESSPNIYADVIPGMDYGYHSRKVSYAWLAGKTKLAPPVTEMGSGANTVAFHYYGSMFPADFWGNILIANWGSHGAFPTNRVVKRYVQQQKAIPDSVKRLGESFRETADTFLYATDSLFRPVGMVMAPDGGIYLADWHGRDDESDSTGRIFKLSHVGRMRKQDQYHPEKILGLNVRQLCELLGSRNKFTRADAQAALVKLGGIAIPALERLLKERDAFKAANAIWTLTQLQSSAAATAMATALEHRDGRVRGLALRQMRQAAGQAIGRPIAVPGVDDSIVQGADPLLNPDQLADLATSMFQDTDGEVRVEAALAQNSPAKITNGLMNALSVAAGKRLQYQIGFELGRYGDSLTLTKMYDSTKPLEYRIALIAAHTAVNEGSSLASAVSGWDLSKDENMGKELLAHIEAGKTRPGQTADRLIVLEWLEEHPRTPNASLVEFLLNCLGDEDYIVKRMALQVLRQRLLQNDKIENEVRGIMLKKDSLYPFLPVEAMYTVASFSDPGAVSDWQQKLQDTTAGAVTATLRALRKQLHNTEFIGSLRNDAESAVERYPDLWEEYWVMFKNLEKDKSGLSGLALLPVRPADKAEFGKMILSALPKGSAMRGKWSFGENCASCHSTKLYDEAFKLGPNLADIGSSSQPQYLIESVLEPDKVLKTGYQVETIETKDGKVYIGQAETRGEDMVMRRQGMPEIVIPLVQIKKRTASHTSPMPDGLYNAMTVKELADLTAYLKSLKGEN
ncbi:DUF7133 domain-containing protein [Agriterribacter sp.]|uniref:DUF7133 domain-containing protein n=1 Tax=Agriterribacter sp. TaxID=2821509 RepID=UPI002BB88D4E|nr:hypothetical protein [Agriterribacter sp.]HTN05341.1 hypothetical protein [Agriterribacter sp.]